ncbi:uncharacterized protein LOC135500763 [Lineus longissimus]|uniref:uncharacterized protein LOC135490010 n=1 Tax=Lineus longissimus TaxID=88925 RepID=UPI00315CD753
MADEAQFVPTKRGGESLIYREFKFRLNRKGRDGKRHWKCIVETCRANAVTDRANSVIKVGEHNHLSNPAKLTAEKIVRGIKRRAFEEVVPIPRIYQEEVANSAEQGILSDDVSVYLPNFIGCHTAAYSHRRKQMPLLPALREDIILEGQWRQTADGGDFLIANDGDIDKLIIFGSVESLMKVAIADTVFMDGTFYIAPNIFTQLYTVHAKIYGQIFPLLYGLLPDKRQATYERFIRLISDKIREVNENVAFNPNTIVVDYEMSALQACRGELPGAQLKGCRFHFGQAIHRSVQRLGLAAQYRDADNMDPIRKWIRRTLALPLVPLDRLDEVWMTTMNEAPAILQAAAFNDYVTANWIDDMDARFDRTLWNHYDRLDQPRTINAVEGWHHKINTYTGHAHPNLYELVRFLKREEMFQRSEIQRLEAGGRPKPRRATYVRVDERMLRLKEQYVNGERDIMSYVDAISYLV